MSKITADQIGDGFTIKGAILKTWLKWLSKSYLYQKLKIELAMTWTTRLGVITEDHNTTWSKDAYSSFVLDNNAENAKKIN
jgi:hypothetical protein